MFPALRVTLKSYHVKGLQNVAGRHCSLARANIVEKTIDRKREEAKLGGGIKRIKSQHSKVSHHSYIFYPRVVFMYLVHGYWLSSYLIFISCYLKKA